MHQDRNRKVDANRKPMCSTFNAGRVVPCSSLWTRLSVLSRTTSGLCSEIPMTPGDTEDGEECFYFESNGDLDLSLKLAL